MGRPQTVFMDLFSLDLIAAPHESLKDISWPVPYSAYANISSSISEQVITQLRNTRDDETLCAILRSKAYDIICDLSVLLRAAINVARAKSAGISLICDDVGSPILHYLNAGTDPYKFPIPRVWHHPVDQRLIRRAANQTRRFFSHLHSYNSGFNRIDIHNRNNLVNGFLSSTTSPFVDWPMANIDWREPGKLPTLLEDFAIELCRSISQATEAHLADQSIQDKFQKLAYRLVAFHLSKAHTDFYILEKHIKTRPAAATLLSGTPKHLGRLASWLYRREGATTIRCAHGGERVFFLDPEWGLAEFPDCDTYYTHGKAERDALERRIKHKLVPTMSTENQIRFKTIGSSHHQNLHKPSTKANLYPTTGKVLYVGGAYLGETFSNFTSIKPPDPLYLDYQIDLLQKLKELGYQVILKPHPGGIISNERFLARYSDKVLNGLFDPTTSTADCFIFDFAGTAFVDALASGRPMVLADLGIRPFDNSVFEDLSARCPIIPAGVNEEGRFRVEKDTLGNAIASSMEIKSSSVSYFNRKFFAA